MELWLLGILVFAFVPRSIPEICDVIPEDEADSGVTQFCLTSLERQFSPLNFSFNGSLLVFTPLPDNRQVEIKIQDDSDGLEAWANLANAFVDSLTSESLPYDVILSYLESSVDTPIASRCDVNRTSGTGDVSISDLLDQFGDWWTPIILVTILGPVFALIFIICGTCLCCCRLCKRCRKKQHKINDEHHKINDVCCVVLYLIVICCICLLFIGVIFAFYSNGKVNDSIRDFDGIVNTAIDNVLSFVEDTQREVNITVDLYDEVNAFLECEINYTHISIGGIVIETFEPAVQALIHSSLVLATQLNASIDALAEVNTTVAQLETLTELLQLELDRITYQTTGLMIMCSLASNVTTVCNIIPNISYTVAVDYSKVDDVSTVLIALQQVDDIESQALQANDSFYAIPCDIRDQIVNQTREILDEAGNFQQIIANITADVERDLSDILDDDGFIGDVRDQSSDIQDAIDEYDARRYAVSIVLCSLTLLVIVVLVIGLLLGANGFKKVIEHERNEISKCGGITLLIGVGLMFVFAVILLFLSSITFFLGASMLKVCYSIAEDPPNNLPSYELFSRVVDNKELWGGYLLGCFLLDNSSVPLTVVEMLNGCRDNGPLYQVARLAERPSLDLEDITSISSQIPDLDGLFEELEHEVEFDRDQILTEDTISSLEDYANAGLQNINYTSYIVQTRSMISTLNVTELTEILEGVRGEFVLANQSELAAETNAIIDFIQAVNVTIITSIVKLTGELETQILLLNDTASQVDASVDDVIRQANNTFDELQSSSIVANETQAVLDRVIAYADSYANWAIDNLENQIGKCRPLYATYSNVYFDVCEDALNGINGFWLAIGWCVLLFIPTIIFSLRLSRYFRQPRINDDYGNNFELPVIENKFKSPVIKKKFELSVIENKEITELHSTWDPQPVDSLGKPEKCYVFLVSPYLEEYTNALQNFINTLKPSKCEVIYLRRIQNPSLYLQYKTQKAQMEREVPDNCTIERELFHGTSKDVCEQINHQGFNRSLAGKNAIRFGLGTYFAVNSSYSFQDTYSPADELGYKYIYICKVLTGEYTAGNADMKVPPPKNPSKNLALYDSLVDNEHTPTIFVAVNDYQAYPQYLVVCKKV